MFLTRPIRARAFAALILLLGGIALFALIEGLVYSGDEEHVTQVRLALGLVALSWGGWYGILACKMAVVSLAREGRWLGAALIMGIPLTLIGAELVKGPLLNIDPVTPRTVVSQALDTTILAGVVLIGLMLVLCFLPLDAWERATDADIAS